jgi:hypothetical protein
MNRAVQGPADAMTFQCTIVNLTIAPLQLHCDTPCDALMQLGIALMWGGMVVVMRDD